MQKDPVTVIVMATMLEAVPFIRGFDLFPLRKHPFPLFKKNDLFVIISGIGKANAAMATAYACDRLRSNSIYNLGAAGAVRRHFAVGDIYHINRLIEYDRPKLGSGNPRTHIPHLLEGFPTASLATGDRVAILPETRDAISHYADLVDMEGAAVNQACRRFRTRCCLFKFISDTPAHTHEGSIVAHIRTYRERFFRFFAEEVIPARV